MFAELGMRQSFCFALIVFVCEPRIYRLRLFDWYLIAALSYYSSDGIGGINEDGYCSDDHDTPIVQM